MTKNLWSSASGEFRRIRIKLSTTASKITIIGAGIFWLQRHLTFCHSAIVSNEITAMSNAPSSMWCEIDANADKTKRNDS